MPQFQLTLPFHKSVGASTMLAMKSLLFFVYFLLCCGVAIATPATSLKADPQWRVQIKNVVADFVQRQTAAFPGDVTYKIEEIDSRIAQPECADFEATLPTGSQLAGKTSIRVRCSENGGNDKWSMFVPVQISITRNLLVSTRQLPLGHTLQKEDLASQKIETTLTEGYVDPQQVLGKVLRYSISAGQVLRQNMLRSPYSVKQGEVVQLVVQGKGFNISADGAALNDASEGQSVQVRNGSGRIVGGVAKANGTVGIRP